MINLFNKVIVLICKTPSSLAGLALAIGSLSFCWERVADLEGAGQLFGAIVASCILIPISLKYLVNRKQLTQDLQQPISGSVIPTLPMALMVLANNLSIYHFKAAELLSWLSILLHLFFFIYFVVYRSINFNLNHLLPSWFIPPIGLVLPIITHPGGLPAGISESLLIFGLLSYAIMLPVVIYRLIFSTPLNTNEKPITVILATPASLLLLGYFTIDAEPNYSLVVLLLILALSMTSYVYFALIKLLQLPFTLTYSAFTFPLVVSAMALFKTSNFFVQEDFPRLWVEVITQLAHIELFIASIMVCYVTFRYILYFRNPTPP